MRRNLISLTVVHRQLFRFDDNFFQVCFVVRTIIDPSCARGQKSDPVQLFRFIEEFRPFIANDSICLKKCKKGGYLLFHSLIHSFILLFTPSLTDLSFDSLIHSSILLFTLSITDLLFHSLIYSSNHLLTLLFTYSIISFYC